MKKVGDNPFDCKVLLTQLLATYIICFIQYINYTLVILYEVARSGTFLLIARCHLRGRAVYQCKRFLEGLACLHINTSRLDIIAIVTELWHVFTNSKMSPERASSLSM